MAKKIDTISKVKKIVPKPKEEKVVKKTSIPEEPDEQYETLFPEPTVSLNKPPLWLLYSLGIILLMLLGIFGYNLSNKKLDSWLSPQTPTPIISEQPTPAATPTFEPTPTPVETATPTPTPTSTPTPKTISKSEITLRVLNGTTKRGAASTARSILTKNGFTVREIGNANHQTYNSTVIYYQPGHQAEAELVQKNLSEYSTSLQESSLANPDMILVVIGNN